MEKELFRKLINILDKEYDAYVKMRELFQEKRELLKKAKSDDLGVLDNKILAHNDAIIKLNNQRKAIAKELISPDADMSRFISLAEEFQPDFVEPLKERKVKICNIFDELVLLNNQNVELIKHGIVITDKMLETIVNAFAPQGSIYNGAGKTTDTHDLNLWTINEEV